MDNEELTRVLVKGLRDAVIELPPDVTKKSSDKPTLRKPSSE